MPRHYDIRLPHAMGNEEENGFLYTINGETSFEPVPSEYVGAVPSDAAGCGNYLRNGGKVYVTQHPEICTPECQYPREVTQYIRANEDITVDTASNFLQAIGTDPDYEKSPDGSVRLQRRVIDGWGNRWGNHDNFGVGDNLAALFEERPAMRQKFFGHIVSRSFVTGAGHVTQQKLTYSQKVDGLEFVTKYSNTGSIYRFEKTEGMRLEVRCGDTNVSDWATWMRTGSMALAITVAQLPDTESFIGPDEDNVLREASRSNVLHLQPDGSIQSTKALRRNIRFQQNLAEYALGTLPKYIGPLPPDYVDVATELLAFCQDMQAVTDGDAPIKSLADRADWAAKLAGIQRKTAAAKKDNKHRTVLDKSAQALDMSYDCIEIQMNEGEVGEPTYGWGYRFRDAGIFRQTIPDDEVHQAYDTGPATTRGGLRSEIFKSYHVKQATSWTELVLQQQPSSYSTQPLKIILKDVMQSKFTDANQKVLDKALKIEPEE